MRASRLFIFAGTLATGLCAAWPFRHDSPPVARPPAAAIPLELTLRRQDVMLHASGGNENSPATGLEASTISSRTPAARKLQLTSLENLGPPPELPVAFQPQSEPAEPMAKTPDEARAEALSTTNRFARPRSYRLRDGDTLEKLAERFLGSRDRATDIFEANRETLARPDLLPVGTTITIPPRVGAAKLTPSSSSTNQALPPGEGS